MKISTKARYGIKALMDLGLNGHTDHVSIKAIAERQNIPERYLEQVFATLRKAGLIRSIKGPQGGYLLACDPQTTSLYGVIRALEGYDTFSEASDASSDLADQVVASLLWQPLDDLIKRRLEATSLAALIEAYRALQHPSDLMFFI